MNSCKLLYRPDYSVVSCWRALIHVPITSYSEIVQLLIFVVQRLILPSAILWGLVNCGFHSTWNACMHIFLSAVCLDDQSLKKIFAVASKEHNSSIVEMVGATHLDHFTCQSSKTFSCHLCGKGFRVKHQFIGHLNTHMSLKPFCCEFCDKSFAYATNLSRHRRTCENNPQNALSSLSSHAVRFQHWNKNRFTLDVCCHKIDN